MPAPFITENWDAYKYQYGVSGKRQFVATGYTDAEQARVAAPVKLNDGFPLDSRIKAGEPEISTKGGPGVYIIDVDYSVPELGFSPSDDPTELLLTPPTYFPDLSSTQEPIDRDIKARPIVNSAGDSFSQSPTRSYVSIHYVYKRYESSFNGPMAVAFANTVNDGQFRMPGFGTVDSGQALLQSIRVDSPFNRQNLAVLVAYTFEVRKDGFKTRILDQGTRAFNANGAPIQIFDADGNQVTTIVRLNGGGIPIDTSYKVGSSLDNPTQSTLLPGDIEIERDNSLAAFIRYEVYEKKNFGALNLID